MTQKWQKLCKKENKILNHKKLNFRWENPKLKRNENIIVNRLQIGHTRLTHGFLMTKEEPP